MSKIQKILAKLVQEDYRSFGFGNFPKDSLNFFTAEWQTIKVVIKTNVINLTHNRH